MIFAFIYILSIFSAADLLKVSNKIKIIFIFSIIILTYDRYLFGGYQEYLLFSFLLIFSKLFVIFVRDVDKNKFLFLLLLLCGNILVWIKTEGLFLFLFLMFLFSLHHAINSKSKALFAILVIFLLIIKTYMFQLFFADISFQSHYQHDEYFKYLLDINRYLERFIPIFLHIVIAMFKYPVWVLVFFCLLFILSDKTYFKNNFYFIIFFIFNIIFIFGSFFLSSHAGWQWQLATTVDRLMLVNLGFYIPLLVFVLNKKLFK